MIRINLLPQTKRAVRTSSGGGSSGSTNLWVGVYLVGIVLWGAALGVLYFMKSGDLEQQVALNNNLRAEIEQVRTKSARLEEVRAELEQSYALEEVVGELNKARTGPVRALMELSQILSTQGGPTIDPQALEEMRRENPLAGFNRSWDVRRLWVTHFEEENRRCRITGRGRTNEDVAEFLRRLALSELFDEVTLERTEAVNDTELDVEFIGFELTCQVTY